MTAQNHAESLQQLNETVTQFTAALAASERRHAQTARTIRRGALILATLGLAWIGLNTIDVARALDAGSSSGGGGPASACNPMDPATMQTQACAFEQVSSFFFMMNELMKGMMTSDDVIKRLADDDPFVHQASVPYEKARQNLDELRSQVMERSSESESSISKEDVEALQNAEQAVANAQRPLQGLVMKDFPKVAGQIVVDFAVLVDRLRKDSNDFRGYLEGRYPRPHSPIGMVASELRLMNSALASVPAMTAQMDLMNRNMASMTYSMGSTMGRMGNWMPW